MQRVAVPPKLIVGGEPQLAPKGVAGPLTVNGSAAACVTS
jgi:hypothetical protein